MCAFISLFSKESLVLGRFSSKVPHKGTKNALEFSFLFFGKKMSWWIKKCHFLQWEQWKVKKCKVEQIQKEPTSCFVSFSRNYTHNPWFRYTFSVSVSFSRFSSGTGLQALCSQRGGSGQTDDSEFRVGHKPSSGYSTEALSLASSIRLHKAFLSTHCYVNE